MGARLAAGAARNPSDALETLRVEGCSAPRSWSNGPGHTYAWHQHHDHKVLFCLEGSIVFHMREGDIELRPGDRLDLEPGTQHAATVGPTGVACVEASR